MSWGPFSIAMLNYQGASLNVKEKHHENPHICQFHWIANIEHGDMEGYEHIRTISTARCW